MLETVASGVVLAIISGLAVIAYKHPNEYARVFYPLMLFVGGAFVLWLAYNVGYDNGFSEASSEFLKLNRPLNQPGILKFPAGETGSL